MALQLGISQSFYNKIESGKKQLTVKTLLDIAAILDTDISEFLNSKAQLKIIKNNPPKRIFIVQ